MGPASLYRRRLPLALVAGVLLLGLKLGSIWQGVRTLDAGKFEIAAAHAESHGAAPTATASKAQPAPPPAAPAEAADPPPPAFTPAEVEVLQQLKRRREALDAREQEILRREDLMKAAEGRIDERVEQLKALQASIERLLETHDERHEAKLRSLVKIYENMKPKDAARIFEELDLETLLSVVERMNERKLSPILAEMKPARAKDVTVELARLKQLFGEGKTAPSEAPRPPNG